MTEEPKTQNLGSVPTADTVADCPPHWWIITTIPGKWSPGICRKCLEESIFPNYIEFPDWKDRTPSQGVVHNSEVLALEEDERIQRH